MLLPVARIAAHGGVYIAASLAWFSVVEG